jgi:hypothetical protein
LSTYPFAVTVFLSAFLLFQIQPLITRHILPWFGGTPAVWSAAMLFFQTLLLAGYAYAHWLSTGAALADSRRKVIVHAWLLAGSVVVLLVTAFAWGAPLLPDSWWRPPDSSLPLLRILVVLLVSVGLPYFMLSTTSPLLQSWFHALHPARSPYRLYALSNLGSFLALISYPIIFEIWFDLPQQTVMWSAGFLVYTGMSIFLFTKRLKAPPGLVQAGETGVEGLAEGEEEHHPTPGIRLLWLFIPACTSVLLLAVTSYLTQEVAVIPFLWVLPLSIYLLSFTITFAKRSVYHPLISVILLGMSVLVISYTILNQHKMGIFAQIIAACFFLLMATIVLHGELYRLRPPPDRLTSFYMLVSLGGVIGSLFVNLAAPQIFSWFWEFPLGVLACWLLVMLLLAVNRKSFLWRRFRRTIPIGWLAVLILLGVLATSGYLLYKDYRNTKAGALSMQRNFYGALRVRQVSVGDPAQEAAAQGAGAQDAGTNSAGTNSAYSLTHGITSHGFQYIDEALREKPTSYYGPLSGIGLAVRQYRKSLPIKDRLNDLRVGVVGLGVGTIAAFGRDGDLYRFYEINPDVIALAEGFGDYFTYLEDSAAEIEIIPGDARVTLEDELEREGPQEYDILAIDAFSGDSIPVHLLTIEAFETYLAHLKPEGVLAVHISNRYLDLQPLLQAVAEHFDLEAVLIASERTATGSYPAVWVLLTRNQEFLKLYEIKTNTDPWLNENRNVRLWTDAYSNLLQFLRRGGAFNIK